MPGGRPSTCDQRRSSISPVSDLSWFPIAMAHLACRVRRKTFQRLCGVVVWKQVAQVVAGACPWQHATSQDRLAADSSYSGNARADTPFGGAGAEGEGSVWSEDPLPQPGKPRRQQPLGGRADRSRQGCWLHRQEWRRGDGGPGRAGGARRRRREEANWLLDTADLSLRSSKYISSCPIEIDWLPYPQLYQ